MLSALPRRTHRSKSLLCQWTTISLMPAGTLHIGGSHVGRDDQDCGLQQQQASQAQRCHSPSRLHVVLAFTAACKSRQLAAAEGLRADEAESGVQHGGPEHSCNNSATACCVWSAPAAVGFQLQPGLWTPVLFTAVHHSLHLLPGGPKSKLARPCCLSGCQVSPSRG